MNNSSYEWQRTTLIFLFKYINILQHQRPMQLQSTDLLTLGNHVNPQ